MPVLGDAPIEEHLVRQMNLLAKFLDERFNPLHQRPKSTGFILMVFPFEGHDGRCNYISNANREDVVVMLKEQLARFEGQPEVEGHA